MVFLPQCASFFVSILLNDFSAEVGPRQKNTFTQSSLFFFVSVHALRRSVAAAKLPWSSETRATKHSWNGNADGRTWPLFPRGVTDMLAKGTGSCYPSFSQGNRHSSESEGARIVACTLCPRLISLLSWNYGPNEFSEVARPSFGGFCTWTVSPHLNNSNVVNASVCEILKGIFDFTREAVFDGTEAGEERSTVSTVILQ